MKFPTKILKALPEATYTVKVTDFYFCSTATGKEVRNDDFVLTDKSLNELVEKKNGYFYLEFEHKVDNQVRKGKIKIWPARFYWTMEQLATKADTELEDSADIIGKEIPLFFAHTYIDKNTLQTVQRKQWQLYDNGSANTDDSDDDEEDDQEEPNTL